MILDLSFGILVGLILGMVMGLVSSLFLLQDSGTYWVWEKGKIQKLESELAQAKAKLREQNLTLEWDLQ